MIEYLPHLTFQNRITFTMFSKFGLQYVEEVELNCLQCWMYLQCCWLQCYNSVYNVELTYNVNV